MLAIRQAGNSVLIQVIDGGVKDGIIPIAEFRTFWDSLNQLGFWRLERSYAGRITVRGETGGSISVSFEQPDQGAVTKTVDFVAPQSCSLEFRRAYDLFENMARFAQSTPDWKTLLGYEAREPIEGLKDWYHAAALRAIGGIRDSQDLDTLLSMFMRDDQYAGAIVGALGNIGSRRAVPALEEFLALQEVKSQSWGQEGLALAAAKVLVSLDGKQSVPAIRRYLDASQHGPHIGDWCALLASVGDYSVVPEVLQILSDSSRYRHEYVSQAAGILGRTGYGSQYVLSALFLAAERELKKDHPDNGTVAAVLSALRSLTGREFIYHSEDSLEVKRSNLAKWLRWWTANAKLFQAGPESPADGYGFVQVNSSPSDVAISLDSADAGNTAPFLLLNVAAGKHRLRLTKERYADWSSTVKVTQGRTTTVNAVLSRAFGSLQVGSAPSGAAISLDGANTRTITPYLFANIGTGKHSLGLTKDRYPGWDSTVMVTKGQMTTARATLKSPPDSLWISYANSQTASWVEWAGPERAVRFNARSGFGYPLHIVKVSAVFYLNNSFPWPDSSFRFKIYGGDGRTLLYESPVLEAIPGAAGPAVVHELSAPVLVDSGEFYLSVVPIDTSGLPSSLAASSYSDWPAPQPTQTDSNKRSYTGSPGRWSPLAKGELSFAVLLRR